MNTKKWNVLIADDEEKVCQLIEYLIPWEELNLSLKAIVHNGLEAMEILKKEKIDIVITDARMPECDGIELLKWCHHQQMRLKYIVISGYRHFEYAHGALQYGVDAYLLKPINQKELIESLKSIVEKLNNNRQIVENEQEMKRQRSLDRDKMRRHFISSFIFDGRNFSDRRIDSLEEINEEYQMQFSDGIYQAFFIKLDHDEHAGYKMDKLLIKIKELTEVHFIGFGSELIGTLLHSGVIFCVNYSINQARDFEVKIEDLYKELEKMLDIFEGLKMTIGIGTKEAVIQGMSRSIASAADAVKYRIHVKKGIISYTGYDYQIPEVDTLWTLERGMLLDNYIRNGNHDGMRRLVFDLRTAVRKVKDISPVVIYQLLSEIRNQAFKVIHQEVEDDVHSSAFSSFEENVDRAVSEDALWMHLEELLIFCIDFLGEQMQMQQTKPVRLMKEYIDQHFAESISLDLTAEAVGLSANYASAIFKKEAGVTFSDYLIAKRMDAATQMLRKTDLSIGDIAEKVGYSDVKYFSKLCKKTLGMKPSVYRKLYS